MAIFSIEFDAILTVGIIALAVLLFYLIATRLLPSLAKGKRAQGKLASVREKAMRDLGDLQAKLTHLQNVKTELKKRYMKGEISGATYAGLDKENDMEIINTQAKISTITDAAGK